LSAFLDTTGNTTLAIGICGRCSLKFPLDSLMPDLNSPGLMVCRDDMDDLDPYRLPPRETEDITLQFPRPDTQLFPTTSVAPGGALWPVSQFSGNSLPTAQQPQDGVQPFVPD
jgi:hypothetical protein